MTDLVGLDKYTIKDIIIGLDYMFDTKNNAVEYINIIIEELNTYNEYNKTTKCSYNKVDIILLNLVPFINYPFNISSIFLIKNEIKHLINQ